MAIPCPHCGRKTRLVGSFHTTKPYCPACGWNSHNAAQLLRSDDAELLVFAVFGAFLAFWEWVRSAWTLEFAAGFCAVFLVVLFAFYAKGRVVLTQITHLPQSGISKTRFEFPNSREAARDIAPPEAYSSVPRSAQFVAKFYSHILIYLAVASFIVAVIFLVYVPPTPPKTGWDVFNLLAVAFLAVLWIGTTPIGFLRNRVHELHLIRYGRVARGTVLSAHSATYRWLWIPSTGGFGFPHVYYKSVVYEFRDSLGHLHKHETHDWSKKLYESMPVTIFYDSGDPNRSVSMECALARLRLP